MYRRLLYCRPYHMCGFIPFFDRKEVEDSAEPYQPPPPPVTGLDRIVALFQPDVQGYPSKEYTSVIQYCSGSFVLGVGVGGFIKAQQAHDNFITTHQSSKFISVYEARRKLTDHITLEFIKHGIRFGTKCMVFTFLLSMSVILISAFRGKDGILEYTIGGLIAGGTARLYLGWMATLAGGAIGGAMSSAVGTFIYLCGKFTNTSISDVRQWQYELRSNRDERLGQAKTMLYADKEGSKTFNNYIQNLKGKFAYTLDEKDVVYVATPDTVTDEKSDNVPAINPAPANSVQSEAVKEANVS